MKSCHRKRRAGPFAGWVRVCAASVLPALFWGCEEWEEPALTVPTLNVSSPAEGARFAPGDTIIVRAAAARAEAGPLLAAFRAEYAPPAAEAWTEARRLENLSAGEFLYLDTLLAPADSGRARWRFTLSNQNNDTVQVERAYLLEGDTL